MQRRPDQLPRGIHGYSREQVAQNQRERTFLAIGEAVARTGYSAVTVEEIREIAGLSRRTFYDHFADKDDAFAEFFTATTATLLKAVDEAARMPRIRPLSRVVVATKASLLLAVAKPNTATAWLTPPGYVTERLCQLREDAMGALERRLGTAIVVAGYPEPASIALRVGVGGACEIVRSRLAGGPEPPLESLAPSLIYELLMPHVGVVPARRYAFR